MSEIGSQFRGDTVGYNTTDNYRVRKIIPQNFIRSPLYNIEKTKLYGGANFVTPRFIDLPPFASTPHWRAALDTTVRKAINPQFLTLIVTENIITLDADNTEIITVITNMLGENTLSQGVIGFQGLRTGQPSVALSTVDIQSDANPSLGGTLDLNGQIVEGVGTINLQGNLAASTLFSPQGQFTEVTTEDITISDSITFKGFTFEDSQILSHTGSNIFGSSSLHTHQFTGSVFVSGSKLKITGSVEAQNITGSLLGTSSFANTSSISLGISGSPDIITSNITASNISTTSK